MTSGATLTAVVDQFLSDIFPDSVRAVQAHRSRLLDFHNALTS
jgi:hypothetical protein